MLAFLAKNFAWVQIGIGILFLLLFLRRWHREDTRSQFKVREADLDLKFDRGEKARASGHEKKTTPFLLSGIRIEGAPHEILDVSALASEDEINRAYKSLMKRYHPDKIGRPGSREWKDAQAIAEALNRARGEMLERVKKRGG